MEAEAVEAEAETRRKTRQTARRTGTGAELMFHVRQARPGFVYFVDQHTT